MNPATPVVGLLEPLRQPEAVHWWPPAPGWWLLGALLLLALAAALRWLWRYHLRGAPLREARRHLDEIRAATLSDAERLADLARLQRRVAIRIAGRRACAALTGPAWADFLNAMTAKQAQYFDATLTDAGYRAQVSAADTSDALQATENWLRDLERPR